jgi:hypothetical protein
MGCDIHAYVEYQNKYGAWEQLGRFRLARWYDLFAFMSSGGNTRRPHIAPVFPARGLPTGMDIFTQSDYGVGADAHHESWLTLQETQIVKWAYLEWYKSQYPQDDLPSIEDYIAMQMAMQALEILYHKTRLVFWFDN